MIIITHRTVALPESMQNCLMDGILQYVLTDDYKINVILQNKSRLPEQVSDL